MDRHYRDHVAVRTIRAWFARWRDQNRAAHAIVSDLASVMANRRPDGQ